MLAVALERVVPAPAAPLPAAPFPGFTTGPRPGGHGTEYPGGGYWGRDSQPPSRGTRPRDTTPRGRRGGTGRAMITVVTLLVVAAMSAGAWALTHRGTGGPTAALPGGHASSHPGTTGGPLQPAGAQG